MTKLNDIIRGTDIKVVISSDWRHGRSINQLQSMLEDYGFIGEIIGVTGDRSAEFKHSDSRGLEKARMWEINDWLSVHPEVKVWCALDDMDMSALQWFVQTDHRVGLSDDNVQVAIKMLTDPIRGKW